MHPFGGQNLPKGLALTNLTAAKLKESGLDSRISLREMDPSLGLTSLGGDQKLKRFSLYVDQYPLCRYEVKAFETRDGEPFVLAHTPEGYVGEVRISALNYVAIEDAIQTLARTRHGEEATIFPSQECLAVANGNYVNVAIVPWEASGLSFESVVNNTGILETTATHFQVDATAKIYPNNVNDDELQEFPIKGLKSGGYLESTQLKSVVDTSTYTRAKSTDNKFNFNVGTDEFDQVSSFVNVYRTLSWFNTLGYNNFGKDQIQIKVHQLPGGGPNNAYYSPASSIDPKPSILIGDGDGHTLQNLATDADVVSHEFGHHVIYHSIKKTSGESLVMHEGIADYFTYARTGNSCLGESICPSSSNACMVREQCLRTADNDFALGDADLPSNAHLQSQFLSGMLWDLQTKDGIGNELPEMVLKAIDLLVSDSGYKHLIIALLTIDDDEHDGKFCKKIISRAKSRGLSSKLEGVSCKGELPAIVEGASNSNEQVTSQGSSSKKKGLFCAIASNHKQSQVPFFVLLVLMPFALIVLRRRLYT
jgi:hypothetical protein